MSDSTLRNLTDKYFPCPDMHCNGEGRTLDGSADEPYPAQCEYCFKVRIPFKTELEALCQEVAREAEKRGWDNCALHTSTEYMILSAKDFREKMANTRSELTQKPAEETETQKLGGK